MSSERIKARRLREQVERIADESPTDNVSVIVQMEAIENLEPYLESATAAIRARQSAVSARAFVPSPAPKEASRRGRSAHASRLAAPRAAAAGVRSASPLRKGGMDSLKPLLDSDWAKEAAAKAGTKRGKERPAGEAPHFWSSGSAVFTTTRAELAKLPDQVQRISAVYPNRKVKLPPISKAAGEPLAVSDHKAYTWGLARTGAMACWGAFDARGEGITVAVLDTGIDPKHPDLAGKIAGFAEFDANGRVKLDDPGKAYDSDEHGTHCAGVVAGGNSSGRWIGMAPEAKILAGLVLKDGSGSDAQILAGMEWAISKGAHVISMSLGGLRMTPEVEESLYARVIINANRMGIPVVVAIGNEGSQTSGAPGNEYFAFTVGATDTLDLAAGFSGGRTQIIERSRYIKPEELPFVYSKPDLTAPGVDVYSAVPGGKSGKWEAWNGSSMATPHVAGAMALLLGRCPAIRELPGPDRADLLQALLLSTVRELGESGQNHRFGHGRLDVLRAFGYAQELGYL